MKHTATKHRINDDYLTVKDKTAHKREGRKEEERERRERETDHY